MMSLYSGNIRANNNNKNNKKVSSPLLSVIATLQNKQAEFHTNNISSNSSDQPDWSFWVNKESSKQAEKSSTSQSLFDLILNKDQQPKTPVSYDRNETLENFFASQTESLQAEQFESLESAFEDFQNLIRPPTKNDELRYMYPLKVGEEHSEIEEQVKNDVALQLEGLTAEEIDKIYCDVKLENDILKQKALRDKNVSIDEFAINTDIDSERIALEQARRAFRAVKISQEKLSPVERKVDQLTKSYTYYLQQKKREQLNQEEKDRKEQMYNVFKKQADTNPEAFNTFAQTILKKKNIPVDFILESYVSGIPVEEIARQILAKENSQLAKPSYEIDSFAEIRRVVQSYIDARQEYCRDILGVKTGKRHATGVTLYADRALAKGDSLGFLRARLLAIRDQDRIERTITNLHSGNTLTKSQKAKRSERSGRRRYEGQKLDNTMKVFMWVKKYRNRILK
ncbi:hypothetical protein NAEGRDRAFT_81296 [Naegleria gruberi]|uniref:Uncharacterized protein n=1 Tax=Naegleria gruberi TaxID=5762 RepID=D2VUT0_NAEGR|nr:uncharacterized protein NAEGRDRAFT_81296 [Naegleria gruberi]EFC39311.1 hypothetical protein NAEGRDRAFT_81296 [Naegleria gruberi]|eukprot:XP_002672055.1 hypothetical protein NAEGRDRAFT_81296 [Naegleria gruberi strain NEG-M]